jgi:polyhydroxybutyrate depolymerase
MALSTYSQEFSIIHDGLERTYRLHLPAGYTPEMSYPLVLSMHGLTSNAFQQELLTGFNQVSDQNGFIVAYPNGLGATWNISSPAGTDDVGFISALIDSLDQEYNVDLNMVYACGMSMGGFMSYRLACELSDRLAAIASVTGLQAIYPCNPPKPLPVLQIHGTADPTVPYAGVPSTVSFWTDHNNCPDEPVQYDFPDINQADSSTVTSYYYGPCNNSTEVILYSVTNGEHSWPGSNFILGVTNQDIDASTEIWKFFRKFNLQGSTGTEEVLSNPNDLINLYPNPAGDYMTVELKDGPAGKFEFRIFDLSGHLVISVNDLTDRRFVVDLRELAPGMYLTEISAGSLKLNQKVVIR